MGLTRKSKCVCYNSSEEVAKSFRNCAIIIPHCWPENRHRWVYVGLPTRVVLCPDRPLCPPFFMVRQTLPLAAADMVRCLMDLPPLLCVRPGGKLRHDQEGAEHRPSVGSVLGQPAQHWNNAGSMSLLYARQYESLYVRNSPSRSKPQQVTCLG